MSGARTFDARISSVRASRMILPPSSDHAVSDGITSRSASRTRPASSSPSLVGCVTNASTNTCPAACPKHAGLLKHGGSATAPDGHRRASTGSHRRSFQPTTLAKGMISIIRCAERRVRGDSCHAMIGALPSSSRPGSAVGGSPIALARRGVKPPPPVSRTRAMRLRQRAGCRRDRE